MADNLSSKKRMRQNARRALRNQVRRSRLKSAVRKVNDAILHKDAETAEKNINTAIKTIDQTASKGTLHRNTAARKKSRLMRRLNALKAARG